MAATGDDLSFFISQLFFMLSLFFYFSLPLFFFLNKFELLLGVDILLDKLSFQEYDHASDVVDILLISLSKLIVSTRDFHLHPSTTEWPFALRHSRRPLPGLTRSALELSEQRSRQSYATIYRPKPRLGFDRFPPS